MVIDVSTGDDAWKAVCQRIRRLRAVGFVRERIVRGTVEGLKGWRNDSFTFRAVMGCE